MGVLWGSSIQENYRCQPRRSTFPQEARSVRRTVNDVRLGQKIAHNGGIRKTEPWRGCHSSFWPVPGFESQPLHSSRWNKIGNQRCLLVVIQTVAGSEWEGRSWQRRLRDGDRGGPRRKWLQPHPRNRWVDQGVAEKLWRLIELTLCRRKSGRKF